MLTTPARIRSWMLLALLCLALVSFAPALAQKSAEPADAWIGVMLGKPGDDFSDMDDEDAVSGVPLRFIVEDSPAHKAGLRARDIISSVNGTPVETAYDLLDQLKREAPGNWVPITIHRNGRERDVRVRLIERPTERGGLKLRRAEIGVASIELNAALREHFGAPKDAGVMISEIEEGSPAEIAGLIVGDVVFEVEGRPVRSGATLARYVESGGVGNTLELTLTRYGAEMIVEAILEARED